MAIVNTCVRSARRSFAKDVPKFIDVSAAGEKRVFERFKTSPRHELLAVMNQPILSQHLGM
jgi:hypothetical protein